MSKPNKKKQEKKRRRQKENNGKRLLERARKRKKKREKKKPVLPTANATTINNLMKSEGVKGSFKDYVVLAGARLVDWQGSHNIVTLDEKRIGVNGVALVHKKNLKNFLPTEIAETFWHPKLGRKGAVA